MTDPLVWIFFTAVLPVMMLYLGFVAGVESAHRGQSDE